MGTNTFRNSVYIMNTAGWWITTDSSQTGGHNDFAISNIGLYGVDSTAELAISYEADTSMVIFHLRCPADGGYADIHFATPHKVSDRMYINTLTAGTGYLYCS